VGPKAGLDAVVVMGKIPSPYRDSNPRASSPQPSAIPLSYPAIQLGMKIAKNAFGKYVYPVEVVLATT
jgi:hypothetical protein